MINPGVTMAYQQGPPGGQPPNYGPPPGYGYPPPTPPKKTNVALILVIIGAVLLLAIGGCTALVITVANKSADEVQKALDQFTPFPSFPSMPVEGTGPAHEVVLEATGDGGAKTASNVTSTVGFDLKQEAGVPLPYSKTVRASEVPGGISLWVQNAEGEGTVTCRIKVDGKVVREATSTGPYGVCRVQTNSLAQ